MWAETIKVINEWLDRFGPASEQGQHIVDVSVSTLNTTLRIISAAGFGRTIPWPDQEEDLPPHHIMTWLDSLNGMFRYLLIRASLPNVSRMV